MDKKARLDADRTAKPLTSIVGFARAGDCVGPGVTVASQWRREDGTVVSLTETVKENNCETEEEEKLTARDERITTALKQYLSRCADEARVLRYEASCLEAQASNVRDAVLAGHWWKLSGLVSGSGWQADVESLSEDGEPVERGTLLGDEET